MSRSLEKGLAALARIDPIMVTTSRIRAHFAYFIFQFGLIAKLIHRSATTPPRRCVTFAKHRLLMLHCHCCRGSQMMMMMMMRLIINLLTTAMLHLLLLLLQWCELKRATLRRLKAAQLFIRVTTGVVVGVVAISAMKKNRFGIIEIGATLWGLIRVVIDVLGVCW